MSEYLKNLEKKEAPDIERIKKLLEQCREIGGRLSLATENIAMNMHIVSALALSKRSK